MQAVDAVIVFITCLLLMSWSAIMTVVLFSLWKFSILFPMRCYASVGTSYGPVSVSVSVCLSVCLSVCMYVLLSVGKFSVFLIFCHYILCDCWQWGSCVIKTTSHLNLSFTVHVSETSDDMNNLERLSSSLFALITKNWQSCFVILSVMIIHKFCRVLLTWLYFFFHLFDNC